MDHRWLARGVVVALHAAALLALWLHRAPPLEQAAERRFTSVRLIAPQRPRAQPPERSLPVAAPPTLPPIALPPINSPDLPPPDDRAVTPATANAPPPAPAEPPRTALRLTLPPGYAASANAARNAARDLALSDPRSNTPRLTLEDRIADATGGASDWVEEKTSENNAQAVGALGEHRTVMRKGNICQEVFRSRISDTDPFNSSVAPRAGKMMGRQYKCR
ncbi:hypothetical protein [Roseateles sp. LYH14W]|uniref:Uncharacterized protein n=1 Tax=Pelomonas parva TaxID=3299032 RepID=A0ABW7F6M9_9BURK